MSLLHVVFKLDSAEYALPADQVLQMEAYEGATPVPGSADFVAGIVQVRGRVVPVIDLRVRFGLPPATRTLDSRIVVGQEGARPVALLVDSAREIVKVDPAQLEPPPPMVADSARGFVRAVARLESRMIMVIDFGRVIGEGAGDAQERQ